MKVAIAGLGGVGGYYGGKLASKYASSADHDVYFIVRGEHLQKIREGGLKVMSTEGEFTAIPTIATDSPQELGCFDLILFCVKDYDLEDTAHLIKENVSEDTIVVSLLNGVDNAKRLRDIFTRGIILNGCVYIRHIV